MYEVLFLKSKGFFARWRWEGLGGGFCQCIHNVNMSCFCFFYYKIPKHSDLLKNFFSFFSIFYIYMIFDRMNYLYIYEFCSKKNKNLT